MLPLILGWASLLGKPQPITIFHIKVRDPRRSLASLWKQKDGIMLLLLFQLI